MRNIIALILLFSSALASATEQPKIRVITNDDRVVYSASDKKLYSVQNQTVCTTVDGKQVCRIRGVATRVER